MSHSSHELLAAYWLGDLDDAEQELVEEHVFPCDECAARLEGMAGLVAGVRELIPPVVNDALVRRLAERGLRLRVTQVAPGTHVAVEFSRDVDMLIHVLHADLEGAKRVDLELLGPDDQILLAIEHVPFDPAGRVQVACQRHYLGVFPHDLGMRLVGIEGGRRVLAEYRIDHRLPL